MTLLRRPVLRPRGLSRGGFTLMELMAVVLLIGVIAALAVTRLDFMVPKYRLRGGARDVASVLKQGKARAAAGGKDCYFEADLSQGRYWLLAPFPKPDPEGDSKTVQSRPLQYEAVFVRSLPEGVHFIDAVLSDQKKLNTGQIRVRLSALGSSSHVILNLINDDKNLISLKMNGFTGAISYQDAYQDAEALLEDSGL
jgi:prepilin-type N-terminal cleavage/methylation domain-containing protein